MKLLSFRIGSTSSYGLLEDEYVVDVGSVLRSKYPDLKSLLAADAISEVLGSISKLKSRLKLSDLDLLPPIPNPGTIWCAGLNTYSHFEEAKALMGLEKPPEKPILFLRSEQSLVGSGENLEMPIQEPAFDYEGEIAVVIGKPGRYVTIDVAMTLVAGFAPFNDGTARSYQFHSSQVSVGKNAYRSAGFGPILATPDEVDLDKLEMICRLNGEEKQRMKLNDLIFGTAELISYISEVTWLQPGDIIVLGSPSGVGFTQSPQRMLEEGDQVEVEVTGIGTLINRIASS